MISRACIAPIIQHLSGPPVWRVTCKHLDLFIVVFDRVITIIRPGGTDKVDAVALESEFYGRALSRQSAQGGKER